MEQACPQWFRLAWDGKRKATEREQRDAWNRTRWLAAAIWNIHAKHPVKPTDLLEWPEERRQRMNELKRIQEKLNTDKRFPKQIKPKTEPHEQSSKGDSLPDGQHDRNNSGDTSQ
ncbi:MAG: hypothetical protein ACK5XN_38925 [Bacteroidota bacterium]